MDKRWAVGLMTGTALDGNVDVALLKTDGTDILELGPQALEPYPTEVTGILRQAMAEAATWNFTGPEPAIFRQAEEALTRAQAAAVMAVLARGNIDPAEVSVIGFHGQTVLHRAATSERIGASRQLGDGMLMARLTGIATVNDFRSADIAAGGQGAPLAPVYHRALLRHIGAGAGSALLNLGGVGNITWYAPDGTLHAFDTGPANAPLDDWIAQHTGKAMDRDGAIAAAGTVDEGRLARLAAHPYLTAPYPKSLDRNDFTSALAKGLSLADGAALLSAFPALCVAAGLKLLPGRVERIVVSGGGRKNPVIMREIASRCGVEAVDADAVGLRGDAVEAECFALLAVRNLRGLPLSFPGTTGVPNPMTGGILSRP
jgi:anhydro-N-acetylmuramic acid kinase